MMTYVTQNCFRTGWGTLRSGLWLGFRLALIYSSGFALYAIVRSSFQIVAALPLAEGLVGTLLANAAALIISILFFALLFGLGAALLQSVTLLVVHGMATLLNPRHSRAFTAWIGLITAGLLAGVIQVAVQRSLGSYFVALWPMGYFFWLGLPSLLFMGATVWICWRAGGLRMGNQVYPADTVA